MAEERFGNYSSCCRLCLSDQLAALKPIFENDNDGTFLVQQILTCLGIEVAQTDKLSTMICDTCLNKVTGWEEYKKSCSENQTKLQNWLSSWTANAEIAGMSIQIKDEPVDREDHRQDSNAELVTIKVEPSVIDDDYYDHPPVLSPHRPLVQLTEVNEKLLNGYAFHTPASVPRVKKNNKQCSNCNKLFTTSGNRLRHERKCYSKGKEAREKTLPVLNASVPSNQEDTSQNSIDSQISRNGSLPPSLDSEAELSENDVQKIQFAAGLRLKSKTVAPNQIADLSAGKADEAPITKIEESYLERSRALLSMLYSFRCACHNIHYNTVKRLFCHLRANYNWFPTYTCYNCLITFSARSGSMRHCSKCPKPHLENCIRLAEMKKRTEKRIRLYQYYKCFACETLFAFYEDYQRHIDQDHVFEEPFVCRCSKEFVTKDGLQKHLYVSCYLNYYCDVCYISFDNLDDFRVHCEAEHDKVYDCSFVEYHEDFKLVDPADIINSRKRKFVEVEPDPQVEKMSADKKFIPTTDDNETNAEMHENNSGMPEEEEEEGDGQVNSEYDQSERSLNTSYNLRTQNKYHKRSRKHKYGSQSSIWKNQPSKCRECDKEFSTYYNMIRHLKTHDESEKRLQCSFCPERFRLVSELKDHLNILHGEAHICQECGKQFETFKQLDQHRSVHLNIKVYRDSKTLAYRTKPRYACDQCDAAFETELELKKHIPIHFVKVEQQNGSSEASLREKYSCIECDRHYLSSKGLWLHNKRHHPGRKIPQKSFKCEVCDKVLSTNAAYHSHKLVHERMTTGSPSRRQQQQNDEDDDYFTCKRCFKVFSTKYNLRTHLKTHGVNITGGRSNSKTGKLTKTFWCDVCHQACQGYQELQKHKQEHINENLGETDSVEDEVDVKPNVKSCEICTKVFITQLAFARHKQKHERQQNEPTAQVKRGANFVFCRYCKIPFLNVKVLTRHMSEEHDELMKQQKPKINKSYKFICNICKKSFDSSGALCSHQGWHKRTQSVKTLKSTHVPQLGESVSLIKQEVKIKQEAHQTGGIKVRHTCATCGLSFVSDTALQIHILEVHRNVNATLISPRCTTCQIEFTSNEAYDAHQKMHNMMPQISFKCKYCPRTFTKCESVNMHINSVHPQHTDGRIKCHECNRHFEKQNALAVHLKVHDRQKIAKLSMREPKPVKVFSCSICFASFEIAKDLRNHIITTHPF